MSDPHPPTSRLLKYFEAQLHQLEAAQGGRDEEARAAFAKLQAEMAVPIPPEEQVGQVEQVGQMNEGQIASLLTVVERQLDTVQSKLAGARPETQAFVAGGAAALVGQQPQPQQPQQQK